MRHVPAGIVVVAMLLVLVPVGCTAGWRADAGEQWLAAAAGPDGAPASCAVAFEVPAGWHWCRRGHDVVLTRDGVFLAHFAIERIHVGEVEPPRGGALPLAALSAKQWPQRPAAHLPRPLVRGMPAAEVAELWCSSQACDPALAEFQAEPVAAAELDGRAGFRSVAEFRLPLSFREHAPLGLYGWPAYAVQGRAPRYRQVACGALVDDWLYVVRCTAVARDRFAREQATFAAFLRSIRLVAVPPPAPTADG